MMSSAALTVREANLNDYPNIVDYFRNGSDDFLTGMGVDRTKLLARNEWLKILMENHHQPKQDKSFYYIIWEFDKVPIGHSNINKIQFGKEAYMHLHMWRSDKRYSGFGLELVRLSIPFFFQGFDLQTLFCEPYALNSAPNKTLPKLGFELIERYETVPGWISFLQPVNRWTLTREKFEERW